MNATKAKEIVKGIEGSIDEMLDMLAEDLLEHGFIMEKVEVSLLSHHSGGIVDIVKATTNIKIVI